MFDGIKRAVFVVKHGLEYKRMYGGEITNVQVELARAGWPVNDFIDWFIAADSQAMSFCDFMENMRMWVMSDDVQALEMLGKWSETPMVRAVDAKGMVGWVGAMVQGARER